MCVGDSRLPLVADVQEPSGKDLTAEAQLMSVTRVVGEAISQRRYDFEHAEGLKIDSS